MKNHFKQRIPNWVSGVEPVEFDFETQEELLAHEVVSRWSNPNKVHDRQFVRYSVALSGAYGSNRSTLMAEFDDGRWWLIGYLDHRDNLTLPIWCPSNKTLEEMHAEHEVRMQALRDSAAKAKQEEIDRALRLLLENGYGVYEKSQGIMLTRDVPGGNYVFRSYVFLSHLDALFTHEIMDQGEALECFRNKSIYEKVGIL